MDNEKKKPNYKVIKKIGEGAYGKAYLAENPVSHNLYVIKTIYIDQMKEDDRKDALLESTILERLDHPNIIRFKETFTMKKPKLSICIVMDYAEGGDMKTKITNQKGKYFEEKQILDWLTQMCLALKHIHDRKILHRDLKSQNIFLSKHGLIKLGDFGIAKCLNFTLDYAKTFIGTPFYLSPEIVQNLPYSFKSDIWSLGVLLYEMCALKMPFDANNLPVLSLKISRGHYNPLPNHFSKELKNLCYQLLSVDQDKRPNINAILRMPIIKSRIKNFLNELEYSSEFSHTVLHNFHPIVTSEKKESFKNKENFLKDSEKEKEKSASQKETPSNPFDLEKEKEKCSSQKEKEVHKIFSDQETEKKVLSSNHVSKLVLNEEKIHKPVIQESFIKNVNNDKKLIDNLLKNKLLFSHNIQIKDKERATIPDSGKVKEILVMKTPETKDNIDIKKRFSNDVLLGRKEKDEKIVSNFYSDVRSEGNNEKTNLTELLKKMNKKYKIQSDDKIKEQKSKVHKNHTDDHSRTQKQKNNDVDNIDYYNVHKMCLELDNMAKDQENELKTSNNDFVLFKKQVINVNDVLKDENYIDTKSDTIKSEDIKLQEKNEEGESDYSHLEEIRIDLGKQLGESILSKVYKIVEESVPFEHVSYNHELISKGIMKALLNNVENSLVLLSIEKIPEVFSLVIKEREAQIKKKTK